MKNYKIQDQYLVHMEVVSPEEFKIISNKINNITEKNLDENNLKEYTNKECNFFEEVGKDKFEKFNNLPKIQFSDNLKKTNSQTLADFNSGICNKIYYYVEDNNYHIIRIEQIYAFNNTDPSGPKVQQPINQTDDVEYILDAFKPLTKKEINSARNNVFASIINDKKENCHPYPVVAILDTGIDLNAFRKRITSKRLAPLHFYKDPFLGKLKSTQSNPEGKVIGYNFYKKGPYGEFPNHPYDNDGYTKHGTRVAKIIAKITKNKVRIMTLKTANHEGSHNLEDIYSAFEYILKYNSKARLNDKVKILNASWAFETNCRPFIFEYYLEKLNENKIRFVSTAGNQKKKIQDEIQLYPALFKDRNKIDVVGDNSGKHGYSDFYVNCCVNGIDKSYRNGNNDGYFKDVLKNTEKKDLFGTSYAAAIYSGYLANKILNEGDLIPVRAEYFDILVEPLESKILY